MRDIEKEIEVALGKMDEVEMKDLNRLNELIYLINTFSPLKTSLSHYNATWSEYMALRKKVLNE